MAYRLTERDVLKALETSVGKLSNEAARLRLTRYGPNRLPEPTGPSLFSKLIRQFSHFLAILLWIAAGLAFLAHFLKPGEGMAALGCAIVAVVVINAIFSFAQEYKADMSFAAIVLTQVANAFACRSEHLSMFRFGVGSSPLILWSIGVELTLLMLLVYAPFGNYVLGNGTAAVLGVDPTRPRSPTAAACRGMSEAHRPSSCFSLVKIGSMQVDVDCGVYWRQCDRRENPMRSNGAIIAFSPILS